MIMIIIEKMRMITIMRIIIIMYVFMRCRRAIGDDVNE